jgi:serine/threonine protein kinase
LEDATECLKQVILGLEQLHKKNYLHRDIKAQNVLLKTIQGQKVSSILPRFTKLLILDLPRKLEMLMEQSAVRNNT